MVAIVIFGILFVGLLNAIFFGIEASLLNSQRIRARQLMTSIMDNLRNLPSEHIFLQDLNPSNSLNDLSTPDHYMIIDTFGLDWEVIWNIRPDSLDSDVLNIRVFVLWRERRFFVSSQTVYYRGLERR